MKVISCWNTTSKVGFQNKIVYMNFMWIGNKKWWSKIQYETKFQLSYLLTFYNDENRVLIRIQNLKDFTEEGKKNKTVIKYEFLKKW